MKKAILCDEDFIGYKKGKIEVIGIGYKKQGKRYYECFCYNCGNLFYQTLSNLLKVKGCGCKNCHNSYLKTHGMKGTRLLRIYALMKQRCFNPKHSKYMSYGGRGITVCDEWRKSFETFMNWALENGYNDDLEIDRINNDGNYCPENCRWVTHRENQYNKRTTVYIEYNSKKYTYLELSKLLNLSISTIRGRLKAGKPLDAPYNSKKFYRYNGKDLTISQISKICNISESTIRHRIKKNSKIDMPYKEKLFNKYFYKGSFVSNNELSKIANIPTKIIRQRIDICGWDVEKAVETPINGYNPKIKLYDYGNEKLCVTEIAKRCGLNRTTLQYRLDNGWSMERATTTNLMKGNK